MRLLPTRVAHANAGCASLEVVLKDGLFAVLVFVVTEAALGCVTVDLGWGAATGAVVVAVRPSAFVALTTPLPTACAPEAIAPPTACAPEAIAEPSVPAADATAEPAVPAALAVAAAAVTNADVTAPMLFPR